MNCTECKGECCKHQNTVININALDLAKILSIIKCTFESIHPKNKGFGHVKHEGKTIIEIMEKPAYKTWTPIAYLTNPCTFLNDNRCSLHYKNIQNNTLEKLEYSRNAKPEFCREHPTFYDTETGKVMRYEPCYMIDDNHIIETIQDSEIIKETRTSEYVQGILYAYYKITGRYPLFELASNIINWKKKNPIKTLEQKINELTIN